MKIDPSHLLLVHAIAKAGTFNKAAADLGMSQPALSKSIALFEQRIGGKVFERGPRGSTLTPLGKIIVRSAINHEQLLLRLKQEIASRGAPGGPLVIGATPSLLPSVVPEAISRLFPDNPHASITVLEGLDDNLMPALQRGKIDLLIGPLDGLRPEKSDIDVTPMMEESFGLGIPSSHRLAKKDEVRLEELIDEPWVLPIEGSSFHRAVERIFLAEGLPWPRHYVAMSSLLAVEGLIETGRCGILTPIQLYKRPPKFRYFPLPQSPKRTIGVRKLSHVLLPPIAESFIEALLEVLSEM